MILPTNPNNALFTKEIRQNDSEWPIQMHTFALLESTKMCSLMTPCLKKTCLLWGVVRSILSHKCSFFQINRFFIPKKSETEIWFASSSGTSIYLEPLKASQLQTPGEANIPRSLEDEGLLSLSGNPWGVTPLFATTPCLRKRGWCWAS